MQREGRAMRIRHAARRIALWTALGACALALGGVVVLEVAGSVGEFPRELLAAREQSVQVLARDGSVLREALSAGDEVRARWVPLHEVSPKVIAALLAAEDGGFLTHQGVDYRALLRAVWYQATGRRSGGSTLSRLRARGEGEK